MTCAFPDCDRPIKSGGWCNGHYMQHYRGHEMRPLHAPRTPIKPTCIGPECSRDARYVSVQLCAVHYQQQRKGKPLTALRKRPTQTTCTGPGCDRPSTANGLCHAHYQQKRTRGELRPIDASQYAERVAEAVRLLDGGLAPAEVVAKLGTTARALASLCRRHGHPRRELDALARAGERKRAPRSPQSCSFDGCGRPVDSRSLCTGHYKQLLAGRGLEPLRKRRRRGEPAPLCSTDGCDDLAHATGLCRRHYNRAAYQRRKPTAVKRAPKPKPLKLPDNVLPIDRPRSEGLPAGWFKPSRKNIKPTAPTAKQINQIIDVPPPNPQLEQMARENLIRMGAEDLLDMLGLGEAS